MDDKARHQLYRDFQEAFPLEKLQEMTLEEYTNLKRQDSFTYWVETKTSGLGSIKGGNSYKFGIYRYNKLPVQDNGKYASDDMYAWYASLGNDRKSVFEEIKSRIVRVAHAARRGDLEEIDSEKGLGETYKWKIAFLYSDENIVPIYNREKMERIANSLGGNFNGKSKTSDIQKFFLSRREGKDIHQFGRELWESGKAETANPGSKNGVRYWIYAPGDNASEWERCVATSTVCLGWDELGDYRQYKTNEEIAERLKEIEGKDSSFKNSVLAVWNFLHTVKAGDIIFVKKGNNKIIGKGIVKGEYVYTEDYADYRNVREADWIRIGEWDAPQTLPLKTLTDVTMNKTLTDRLNSLTESGDGKGNNYWWLVASPDTWKYSDIKEGETVEFTVKNEKGKFRNKRVNFENAREGDPVIGYESYPTKKIVALMQVVRPSDGETIGFRKLKDLVAPVGWFDFKEVPELQNMEYLKNQMGTLFKLTEKEYDKIVELINGHPFNNTGEKEGTAEKYDRSDFLREVFLSENELDRLINLLKHKKNMILHGAPGVGKTFAAKRLAYVMMGEKDKERLSMVQFHQSYAYEDFILGFKPTAEGGFKLQEGVFYEFCRKASQHPGKDYFFIIDEINRGNLSKIFGELLMLIEAPYRDETIKTAYNHEEFCVPSNLYIIGMMNTADRSLALIDYALRRRFAFFPVSPGFEKESFRKEISLSTDERVAAVVEGVKKLNEVIARDDSLGEGFCIGHSYFCNPVNEPSWIENIVRYEICPMLEEYWFDNKEKAEAEKKKLLALLKTSSKE